MDSGNGVSPSDILEKKNVKQLDSYSVDMSNDSTASAVSRNTGDAHSYSADNSDSSPSWKRPSTKSESGVHPLHYKVTEIPPWKQSILLAFQQTMVCISGILTVPYLVSEIACAGNYTTALRVKLISSTFFVTGLTTLLQTSVGLRLPILQGASLAFFPPLYAFANLPQMKCNFSTNDHVPEEFYLNRIQMIQGSLICSSMLLTLIGFTGAIGMVSKLIGPITIFPLLMLLCLGNIDVIVEKAAAHWISVM